MNLTDIAELHVGPRGTSDLTFGALGTYKDDFKKVDGRLLLCRHIKHERHIIGSIGIFEQEA